MSTQAQIIANQANAKKSTGPTTEAGKAKSSKNRLSYGFASSTRFIEGEIPALFYALLNDLIGEYHPATPTEQMLVEDIAHHRWLILRARRIQGDILGDIYTKIPGSLAIGKNVDRNLPLFIRYQTTAERAFHKSHQELVKAQKERRKSGIGFESKNTEDAPVTHDAAPPEPPQDSTQTPPKPAEKPTPQPDPMPKDTLEHLFNHELGKLKRAGVEGLDSLFL